MSPATVLGALAYPVTIAGAVLIFGLSTQTGLSLFSDNIGKFTSPVSVRGDFNLPPVKQLADLHPPRTPMRTAVQTSAPYSSFATVAAPPPNVVRLATPAQSSITDLGSPTAQARVGAQAVNLRAAPSKTSQVLGVLTAGAAVSVLDNESGWIRVNANGRSGWVYKSYLTHAETVSITVSGGVASLDP